MTELKIFENEEFGEVRTVLIEGEPWLVGKDVAKILGYSNTAKSIRDHVEEEDKLTERIVLSGQNRKIIFINESGLYSLVLSSKLPTAKKFKRWITSEVIPSIRKYGGYITEEILARMFNDPNYIHVFLTQMLEMTEKIKALNKTIFDLQPKADYFDYMMNSDFLINFRNTAKELKVKPLYFVYFLLEKKYLYRDPKKVLLPYQKYVEQGYFETIEFCKNGHKGLQTLITPQGRNHFLQLYLNGKMEAGTN